jgi:hypothetical protein
MQESFWGVLILICALLVFLWSFHSTTEGKNFLCNHRYALCTSAACIPDPNRPETHTLCFCDVEEGTSLSTEPCDTLRPRLSKNGVETVYSTFSLKQMEDDKLKPLTCPAQTPWSWCLNKKCIVNPRNPRQALCSCDIKHNGPWVTLGGNQNPATCDTGYWSGAPIPNGETGWQYLTSQGRRYPNLL